MIDERSNLGFARGFQRRAPRTVNRGTLKSWAIAMRVRPTTPAGPAGWAGRKWRTPSTAVAGLGDLAELQVLQDVGALGFSLKPPKFIRKLTLKKLVKPLAIAAAVVAAPTLIPMLAKGGMVLGKGLLTGAKFAAKGKLFGNITPARFKGLLPSFKNATAPAEAPASSDTPAPPPPSSSGSAPTPQGDSPGGYGSGGYGGTGYDGSAGYDAATASSSDAPKGTTPAWVMPAAIAVGSLVLIKLLTNNPSPRQRRYA